MNGKRFYLLTGKIICRECGASYVGSGYVPGRNGKKYPIYAYVNKRNHTCSNKTSGKNFLKNMLQHNLKKTFLILRLQKKSLQEYMIN